MDELDPLDPTTKRFLAEGDAHERRGWDDVLLDDDVEPKRYGGSVDKVPRRRSAIFAFVMLCICVGSGFVVGGLAVFKWMSQEPAAVSPPMQTPPEPPRTDPQPKAQPPAQPLQQPVAQPRAPAPVAQPRAPTPVAQAPAPTKAPAKAPVAAPKTSNAAVPPDPEGAERLRQDAIAVRKKRQRHAEKDMVWSQELKMLVPAEYLEHPPAQPSAAPGR